MPPSPPRASLVTIAGSVLLAALPIAAAAQQELPVGLGGPALRLDVAKPIFDIGPFSDSHPATSVWDASLVVPIRPQVSLFAQMGFTLGQQAELGWSGATTNPRVGALLGRDAGLRGALHIDLPLAQEMGPAYANEVGRYTRFAEWARYGTETWAVGGWATAETELSPGGFAGLRLGGTYLIPRSDGADHDLLLSPAVFAEAPIGRRARFLLELSTVALVTQPELDFDQATAFFGTVSLSLPIDRLAPELYLVVPLDESLAGTVNFVVGGRLHVGSTRPAP